MATVGISQKLIEEVGESIKTMGINERTMRLGKLHETHHEVTNDKRYIDLTPLEADDLMSMIWGVHLPLESQIPNDWKVFKQEFQVSWSDTYTSARNGEPCTTTVHFKIRCDHAAPFPFPPGADTYSARSIDFRPLVAQKYMAYLSAKNAVAADVGKKYTTIDDQVVGYLKSCKSLNAAVKALPDIKLYIPQKYLDRLEVKVERAAAGAKAEEHAAVVDTTLIVSTAVMHKFMGAQT